ncbi:MAG: hypothetical protein JXA03_12750 [Bacteroidales bacterium]|nr:hypothetical protein [Bacteroidales bacterium]
MKTSVIILLALMFVLMTNVIVSQNVTITDDANYSADNSAMLDVKSLNKGLLIPRMSVVERDAISLPATGLLVFVTNDNNYYYFDGAAWKQFSGGSDGDWIISGNNLYSALPGNVGIGVSSPQEKLEIAGNIRLKEGGDRSIFVGEHPNGDPHCGYNLSLSAGNSAGFFFGPTSYPGGELMLKGGTGGGLINPGKGGDVKITAGNAGGAQGSASGGHVCAWGGLPLGNGNPGNVILAFNGFEPWGKVAIGHALPGAELDVLGKTKTNDLQVASPCSPGDVLTAIDINGNAVWQQPGGGGNSWNLNGNVGTVPGTDFLGTADNTAFQVHVNNNRAFRIEPHYTSPNLIGGYLGNFVGVGIFGAAIGGGGTSGYVNQVLDNYGVVCGGYQNTAGDDTYDAYAATVSGGSGNTAGHRYTSIGGGHMNTANRQFATVAGGSYNTAHHQFATVGGGSNNYCKGDAGTISGGAANKIGVDSYAAAIPGGYHNSAYGMFSFAAGNKAKAMHNGSVVIAANSATWVSPADSVNSGGDEQMVLRADGGMFITNTGGIAPYTPNLLINTSTGAFLSDAGVWTNAFDEGNITGRESIDNNDILEKVASLEILRWSLKNEPEGHSHIGPTASELNSVFGLANDGKSITTLDPAGIALTAIQALYQQIEQKDAQIADLERRLQALESVMTACDK